MTSRAVQNRVAPTTVPTTLPTRSVEVSTIVIERVDARDRSTMDTVRAFHRRGSQFLGPMPRGAFEGYAGSGGLIVARSAQEAIGYALFASTDRYVRLIHLFVDDPWRRTGVARRLVGWISDTHQDRPGIRVSSRRDHARADVWARLGFVRRAERPGRGRDRAPLVVWWRDHGLPGLFTPSFEAIRVRAAVDINVLRDWVEVGRSRREASLALTADQLSDQLAIFRTPTLEIEIERLPDAERRGVATAAAGELAEARIDDDRRRRALAELRRARQAVGPKAHEVSDEDLGYLSEAIGAGLDVFVTKDARLASILRDAAAVEGLRILRPEEVIVRIDELVRSAAYHPRSFEGTELTTHLLGPGENDRLLPLASTNQGESRSMFTERVAGLTRQGYERVVVEGPDGSIVACVFHRAEGTVLDVALFRVRNDSMGPTLARQLLFRLRHDALVANATAIRITDPRPSRPVPSAIDEDGYLSDRGTSTTLVLDVAGSRQQVEAAIRAAERLASIAPSPPIRGTLTVRQAADIERARWPAKVLDAPLPTFALPIRQTYATTLLNVPQGLLARPTGLGMSRTHVYFRSARGGSPSAPSRLLWYLSKNSVCPAGIVATSQLDDVVEDDPDALFDRFEHLGVWTRTEVREAGRGGAAQALVFSNTEVFEGPIDYEKARRLIKMPLLSPRRLSPEVFARIYGGRARRV